MRILLISPSISNVGGVESHVRSLSSRLLNRGFDIDILSSERIPIINIQGFKNASFSLASSLWAFIGTRLLEKYDVIHAQNPPCALPMSCSKTRRRILTIHGVYSEQIGLLHGQWKGNLTRFLEPVLLVHADRITCVSKQTTKHYVDRGFHATYVPNGIDFESLPRDSTRLFPKQVIYVGRLSKEKGVDVLIQAFRSIRDNDIRLLLVGTGPLSSMLRAVAESDARVLFLGAKPHREAIRLIAGSDALLLPSRMEGLSTVLLEAMAVKTPVVATAVGGNTELIEHNRTGLLVPPDNASAIKESIEHLFEDKGLKSRVVANGYQHVRSEYDWNRICEQYIRLYTE